MQDEEAAQVEVTNELFQYMSDLYWKTAAQEIRNMILFYNEISDQISDEDAGVSLDCQNFREIVKLWVGRNDEQSQGLRDQTTKPVQKGDNGETRSDALDSDPLLQDAFKRANDQYGGPNLPLELHRSRYRMARALLESSGFLDLDIMYEHGRQQYPSQSWTNPNIELVDVSFGNAAAKQVLRAVRCCGGVCRDKKRLYMRSKVYYECDSGCKDRMNLTLPVQIPQDLGSGPTKGATCNIALGNRRLCPDCMLSEPDSAECPRSHFVKKYHENPTDSKDFSRKISDQEDFDWLEDKSANKDDNVVKQWVKSIMDKNEPGSGLWETWNRKSQERGSVTPSQVVKMFRDRVSPAGDFHLIIMFGTLSIETGIDDTKRGIVISPRPLPTLFDDCMTPLNVMIEEKDRIENGFKSTRIILSRSTNGWDRLEKIVKKVDFKDHTIVIQEQDIGERNTLGCMKRVYGGAFSGYLDSVHPGGRESQVVLAFVEGAKKVRSKYSKTVRLMRQQLYDSGGETVKQLKKQIGKEVDKHLRRIAIILPTRPPFQIFQSNCQKLVTEMLKGKDFRYVFPKLATYESSVPRYLISFGERNELRDSKFGQKNSLFERFVQQDQTGLDLIEVLEQGLIKMQKHRSWSASSIAELDLMSGDQDQINCPSGKAIQALWELPRDSLSILQSHFQRPAWKYRAESGQRLVPQRWLQNRILALQQLDVFACLAGGLGSSLCATMVATQRSISPMAHIYGNARSDEKIRRISSQFGVAYLIGRNPDVFGEFFGAPDEVLAVVQHQMQENCMKDIPFLERAFKNGNADIDLKILLRWELSRKLWEKVKMHWFFRENKTAGSWLGEWDKALLKIDRLNLRDGWIYAHVGELIYAQKCPKKLQQRLEKLAGY